MKKILSLVLCLAFGTSPAVASSFPPLDPPSYFYIHITTATTNNAVFTGAGTVRRVCVGTPVAAGSVTVYDALTATGTGVTVTTTPAAAGNPFCMNLDAALQTGLTIVTVGAQDVTVTYQH